MRLLVMFDMPVDSKKDKREYLKFRNFLLNNGYDMLQYSVYVRFCRNDSDAKKHLLRLNKNAPKTGNVRVISVTEKQFENMVILTGTRSIQEKEISSNEIIIIE